MAFDGSALTAFTQEERFRDDWWVSTADNSETLKNQNLFQVITKIKGPIKLPKFAATATWQDGDGCTFSASGNDTMTQATLTPGRIKVNKTWCIQTLEDYFTQGGLPAGSTYENLGFMENTVLNETVQASTNNLEVKLWNATTVAAADKFNGWLTIAQASGPAATSTGTLTSANTLGFVEGLINDAANDTDQTLATLMKQGKCTIWLGLDAFRLYDLNYRTTYGTTTHADPMGALKVQGTNVKIVAVPGLSGKNVILLVPDQNMVLGTDVLAETSALEFGLDQYKENIWGKMRFRIGCQFRDVSLMKRHAAA